VRRHGAACDHGVAVVALDLVRPRPVSGDQVLAVAATNAYHTLKEKGRKKGVVDG
jgi:hypothetical protein